MISPTVTFTVTLGLDPRASLRRTHTVTLGLDPRVSLSLKNATSPYPAGSPQ